MCGRADDSRAPNLCPGTLESASASTDEASAFVCVGTSQGQVVESDVKGTMRVSVRGAGRSERGRGWSERKEGKMRQNEKE